MIIGEAPGRDEVRTSVPFVGDSGGLLDDALARAQSSRSHYFITNLFKGDVGQGDPDPTPDQLKDHADLLRCEFTVIRPVAVLLLGRIATRQFLMDCRTLGPWVGKVREHDGLVLIPCWHPGAVLRDRRKLPEFQKAVATFVAASR
jgi:DNA polymerase